MSRIENLRKRLWRTTFNVSPTVSWVNDHMRTRFHNTEVNDQVPGADISGITIKIFLIFLFLYNPKSNFMKAIMIQM